MADYKTHQTAGKVAGALVAALRARREDPVDLFLEALGGALGGASGAKIPDHLEPASSGSHHRCLVHSVGLNTGLAVAAHRTLPTIETFWRETAASLREQASEQQGIERFLSLCGAALCHVAVGFGNGVVAGHLSHVVLDAHTPRSIPLLFSAQKVTLRLK